MTIVRLNYFALDRPDIQYAATEVSKRMPRPQEHQCNLLKIIGGHSIIAPRVTQTFQWQISMTTGIGVILIGQETSPPVSQPAVASAMLAHMLSNVGHRFNSLLL